MGRTDIGRWSLGDLGSLIFGMEHILALFHFFTNVYFEIWVLIICAKGDAIYFATRLIKDIGMLSNSVDKSLRIPFVFSTSSLFIVA